MQVQQSAPPMRTDSRGQVVLKHALPQSVTPSLSSLSRFETVTELQRSKKKTTLSDFRVHPDQSDNSVTDLTMLPQTSVPTYLVAETRWHLGAAHKCQIKLVYLSEYAVFQQHLTELEASQAHLLREATNRLVATPAIHHVSLTVCHRSLNHTFLAWCCLLTNCQKRSVRQPRTKSLSHRRVEEPGRMRRKLQGMFLAQRWHALRVLKNKPQARHLLIFRGPTTPVQG